jgi:hypothetical protein
VTDQLAIPEAHRDADLLGVEWRGPHGRAVVVSVGARVRLQVERPDGSTFPMEWPAELVRREIAAAAPHDEWLPSGDGSSSYNATENRRLVALGLVPLAEPVGGTAPFSAEQPRPEVRHPAVTATEGGLMEAASPAKRPQDAKAKAKKSGLASLSKKSLREKLLATPTIADHAWNGAYGSPKREKGETREVYIKRVLA